MYTRVDLMALTKQSQAASVAHPLGKRILDIDVDYTAGTSPTVSPVISNNPRAQNALKTEIERWGRGSGVTAAKLREWWRQYLEDGELLIAFRGMRPYTVPARPMTLDVDKETRDPLSITRELSGGGSITYEIINGVAGWTGQAPTRLQGTEYPALWFRHGKYHDRGVPEMAAILRRLEWETQSAELSMRRFRSILRWFWHAVAKNASDNDLTNLREAYETAPETGGVFWSNEAVEWKPVSVNLAAGDISTMIRGLRGSIVGAAGQPLHWHGTGEDANLATASSMGQPTFKHMEALQGELKGILTDLYTLITVMLVEEGRVRGVDPLLVSWDITLPVVDAKDYGEGTRALLQAVTAADTAAAQGYITEDEGRRIVIEVGQKVLGMKLSGDAPAKPKG